MVTSSICYPKPRERERELHTRCVVVFLKFHFICSVLIGSRFHGYGLNILSTAASSAAKLYNAAADAAAFYACVLAYILDQQQSTSQATISR